VEKPKRWVKFAGLPGLTEWGKEMCPALDALLEWAALRPKHSPDGRSDKENSRK
jgi:DNA-binding HxlR family transcriptional regulator